MISDLVALIKFAAWRASVGRNCTKRCCERALFLAEGSEGEGTVSRKP